MFFSSAAEWTGFQPVFFECRRYTKFKTRQAEARPTKFEAPRVILSPKKMSAVEPVPPPTPKETLLTRPLPPIRARSRIGASALRKASVRLIPLIAIAYGVAYTDRVNISFAALQMNRDLHFSASAYGLGAGLFFLSYAACEIPSNLLLYRFGARRWIARIMITWGLLAMGMMFVKTPLEFYAVRFLLGMAEAGFFPGVVYYLSQWFPANVRARTVSRFYVALPLSSVFMGGLAGALLNLQGRLGLAGWQWLFLAEGFPAVILSVIFFFFLPNTPAEAKWLTAAERDWLVDQLRADNTAIGERHSRRRFARDPESPRVAARPVPALHLHRLLCVLVFRAGAHSAGHWP